MKKFTEVFTDAAKLQEAVKNYSAYPDGLWSDDNWFVPVTQLFKQLYSIFTAKTLNKVFIWNDYDTQKMIDGFFVPLFWEKLLNFYTHQLAVSDENLKKLTSIENLGDIMHVDDARAMTTYSQPTKSGIEWDNEADAPTRKSKNLSEVSRTNIIKNMEALLYSDITVYWTDYFLEFEKFFIHTYWLGGDYIENSFSK